MYIQPITIYSNIPSKQALIKREPAYEVADTTLPGIVANNTKIKREQNNLLKFGICLMTILGCIGLGIYANKSYKKSSNHYVKTAGMDFISLVKDETVPTIEKCKSLNPILKEHLTTIINYLNASESVKNKSGITSPGNLLLLSGPPGVGKSFYAKVLAKSIDAKFMEIKFADYNSRWAGEDIENLQGLFENIFRKAKSEPEQKFVAVFNEIESAIQPIEKLQDSRMSGHTISKIEERSTLLTYIENIEKEAPNLTFIGTTNQSPKNNGLDGAFLSRFKNIYEIDFPNKDCLYEALIMNLNKMENGESFVKSNKDALLELAEEMAKRKCSFRDLNSTINNSKNAFLKELLKDSNASYKMEYLKGGLKNIQITDGELLQKQ